MTREFRIDGELKLGEAKLGEPKLGEPKLGESKLGEPKLGEPKLGEPRLEAKPPTKHDYRLDSRSEAEVDSMMDLFQTALKDLHKEAPIELLRSLRESLEHIRVHNPNSAHTAKACLLGLASDSSTLLHALTAAYLVNGGVMLKAHPTEEQAQSEEDRYDDLDFRELEAELSSLAQTLPSSTDADPGKAQAWETQGGCPVPRPQAA